MTKLVRIQSRTRRGLALAPDFAARMLGMTAADFETTVAFYLRPPRHEHRRLVALSELEHWGEASESPLPAALCELDASNGRSERRLRNVA